eukprot:6313233-Karenia_brevis.AAC.1
MPLQVDVGTLERLHNVRTFAAARHALQVLLMPMQSDESRLKSSMLNSWRTRCAVSYTHLRAHETLSDL